MCNVAVFIDAGHYHYRLFKEGWRIDCRKFIEFFGAQGYTPDYLFYFEGMPTFLSYSNVYSGATHEAFNQAKRARMRYFAKLRSFGFEVHHKPVELPL
jgi:hypothetical protein